MARRMNRVTERDMGWDRIQSEFAQFANRAVTAGLHEEDAGTHDPDAVMRGYFNEFGTDTAPARSFIRSTHDEKRRAWIQDMQRELGNMMDGRQTAQGFMESVGSRAAEDIRQTVIEMTTPANAPRTIAQKGFDDPLIETGEMRDAIDYQVRG